MAMMPTLGVIGGATGLVGTLMLVRGVPPKRLESLFRNLQLSSAAFVALTHGFADVQRTLGALAIAHGGAAPGWPTAVAAALVISLGTAAGGWRLIEAMGTRIVKLRPIDGFVAETVAAWLTAGAALAGLPASTTHATAASIVGVGVVTRASAVSWGLTQRIVAVWILTPLVPGAAAALFGALARLAGSY
jgi:PiT family inorganic phosphate transporter